MKVMNMFWSLVDAILSRLSMFAEQDEKVSSTKRKKSPLELNEESEASEEPRARHSKEKLKTHSKPMGGVHNETATFNHPRKGLAGGRRH